MNLAEFKGSDIRPTADRVKESLFNILYGEIAGARVLDLFCGSGNLGIECLSRGAAFVYFNDVSKDSLKVLKSNLIKLKEENYAVTCSDYLSCLAAAKGPFDFIFIDPPYRFDYGIPAMQAIVGRRLLSAGGAVVYERDRPFEGKIDGLVQTDERKYGKTYLTFFRAWRPEQKGRPEQNATKG